jgi:hypothetical protein
VKFWYDDTPDQFAAEPREMRGEWRLKGSRGLPMLPVLRPPESRPPCCWCPKQPDEVPPHERTPATAEELTPENQRAYLHYLECKAVGQFPDDDLVRRNAMVIAQAVQARDEWVQLQIAAVSAGRRIPGV